LFIKFKINLIYAYYNITLQLLEMCDIIHEPQPRVKKFRKYDEPKNGSIQTYMEW